MKALLSKLPKVNPNALLGSLAPKRVVGYHAENLKNNKLARKLTLQEQNDKNKETERNYLQRAFSALIFASVLLWLWPSLLPFGVLTLWTSHGSMLDWLNYCWPIFVWGGGLTAFFSIISRNKPEENRNAEENLAKGFAISIFAGVTEEIAFRWCIFLSAGIGVQIVNWLLGGFMGFGLVEMLQIHLCAPVANFFTLGILNDVLTNKELWYVGAGLLASNAAFRDGHKYLGLLGYVNSWFIGMVFFAMTFKFGLGAAIFVHFLYDALIFCVRYLDEAYERAQGNV